MTQFDWTAHQDKVWEYYAQAMQYFGFFNFGLIISVFFLVTFSIWFVARFFYILGFIDIKPNISERLYMAATDFEVSSDNGARPIEGQIVTTGTDLVPRSSGGSLANQTPDQYFQSGRDWDDVRRDWGF